MFGTDSTTHLQIMFGTVEHIDAEYVNEHLASMKIDIKHTENRFKMKNAVFILPNEMLPCANRFESITRTSQFEHKKDDVYFGMSFIYYS